MASRKSREVWDPTGAFFVTTDSGNGSRLSGDWSSVLVAEPELPKPPKELLFRRRVSLWPSLVEMWDAREITRSLAERQLRARYKQAILGFLWAIITPLVLMVAFTLVFDRVGNINTQGAPYSLFSYLGLLPWSFFSAAVTAGSISLISNLALINKIFCPREVFPLSGVVVAAIDLLLSLLALAVLFVVLGFAPRGTSVWVVLIIPVLLLTTIAWSILVAVTTVYVRDLRTALPLILQVGLFATPVAYGFDVFPRDLRGIYSFLNPLGPVIDGLRRTVLFGQHPDFSELGLAAVGAVLYFMLGYWAFKRMETGIADVA